VGRPGRERDAEAAREAIIEAGEEVFARKGFDGARIDSIAAESGYNKSLIFHYFGDKDGLYQAIIARLRLHLHHEYLEPIRYFVQSSDEMNATRVRLLLEMVISQYLAFLTDHPRNLHIMAWEAADGWRTFKKEPVKDLEQYKASVICVVDFLRRAQSAGIINPELNMHFLSMSLVNLCIMHLLSLPRDRWLFEGSGGHSIEALDSIAYIRKQILQLILNGIFVASIASI
jgi:TetR/AcrR family transcriptional regulator